MVEIIQKRLDTRKVMTDEEIIAVKKVCEMMKIDWSKTIGISFNIRVYRSSENES